MSFYKRIKKLLHSFAVSKHNALQPSWGTECSQALNLGTRSLKEKRGEINPCFDVSFHIFAPRLGSWIDHIATRIEKGLPLEMKECPPLETMSVTCAHESLMEESSILLQVCCNSEIIPLAQENPAPPFQCLESVNVLEQPGGGGARTTTAATVRRNCPGD